MPVENVEQAAGDLQRFLLRLVFPKDQPARESDPFQAQTVVFTNVVEFVVISEVAGLQRNAYVEHLHGVVAELRQEEREDHDDVH